MYSGRRHIDNGEAVRHNEQVEQARKAEHLRRCAESPAYKRVYERWKKTMAYMQSEQAKVHDVIDQAMRQQQITNVMGNCETQPVHIGPPLPPPSEQNQLASAGFAFSAFMIGALFTTEEQRQQLQEDLKAMGEMDEVNKRYDRQMIRMSGFEW